MPVNEEAGIDAFWADVIEHHERVNDAELAGRERALATNTGDNTIDAGMFG
jgi:hypothetical protein